MSTPGAAGTASTAASTTASTTATRQTGDPASGPTINARPPSDPRWQGNVFTVRERRLTLGRQFRVFDAQGHLIAYVKQKWFKLKEEVRFFSDESQTTEVLRVQAENVLDFSGRYNVIDAATGQRVGQVKRDGWGSFVRGRWTFHDADGVPYGTLREDSLGLALLRRFLLGFLPTKFKLNIDAEGGEQAPIAAEIDERFQLFGDTYDLRLHDLRVDPRLLVAAAVMIDITESAKNE